MTELLEKAIDSVKRLDPARQDEIARVLLSMADEDDDLTPEDLAALAVSEAESARGDYASDEEIAAIWAKHGL
jgi:hypothetical protein